MRPMFTNATVAWSELDILKREGLIHEIPAIIRESMRGLNNKIHMERCETPIIVPAAYLQSHIDAGFNMVESDKGYLRPETTVGTYQYLSSLFPQKSQLLKRLPICLWQVGLSFRDEKNPDTMRASKLRLTQFYQMEFQLFTPVGTLAPYLETVLNSLVNRYGGTAVEVPENELPHYSQKTIDWYIQDLEVAGCSIRTDCPYGPVFEVAIGLDRLVALL